MTTNNELIERLRGFEQDHKPDGWPAIQMRDVTALLDTIEAQAKQIEVLRKDWKKVSDENGFLRFKQAEQINALQDMAAYIGVGGYNGATPEQLIDRIHSEFKRLSTNKPPNEKIKAMQSDAERYRWLVSQVSKHEADGGYSKSFSFPHVTHVDSHRCIYFKTVDEAIDAALSAQKGGA